jgi:hypothetical protein
MYFCKVFLYDGYHDLLHHLYNYLLILLVLCSVWFVIRLVALCSGDGRGAVIDLHVY